jgi:hypothetical protein
MLYRQYYPAKMEWQRIQFWTSRMQSEHSTTKFPPPLQSSSRHFPRSLIWKALKPHPSFIYLDISAQKGWNYRFPSLGEIPVAGFWQVTTDPSWSPRKLVTLIYKKLRVIMKAFISSKIRTGSWPSFIIKSLLRSFSHKNELNVRARVVIIVD